MKVPAILVGVGVVVVIGLILLFSSLYTVSEYEWVVVTEFGKPVRVLPELDESGKQVTGPGLYAKTPFIQSVHRIEKRIIAWDGAANRIPTRDKKYIWIDTFARWRVARPLPFYTSVQGRIDQGQKKLDDIIDAAVRDVVGNYNLIEVVRSSNRDLAYESEELAAEQRARAAKIIVGRAKMTDQIRQKASADLDDKLGIEVVDVRIKRVNYVQSVRTTIYERMKSERERIAARYLSEAQEQGDMILGETNRVLAQIKGESDGRSAEIRGTADAEAIRLYGEAIAASGEFYEFLRTLEAYKMSIDERTTLLLSTEADFLRFFKRLEPLKEGGRPPVGRAREFE